MGYRNVSVFAAGYPAWKQYAGTPAPTVAAVAAATEGEVIEIAAFEKLIKENPESILLIDVRDPDEYATGHFKTAINMPVDQLEKEVATLPADKPIVFVCSTGARSGESYYMLQDSRPELKNVQYLDATVTVKKDGSYEIKKN